MTGQEQPPALIVAEGQMVIPEIHYDRRTTIVWSRASSISGIRRALQERIREGQEIQSRRTRAAAEAIRNSRLMIPLFEMPRESQSD